MLFQFIKGATSIETTASWFFLLENTFPKLKGWARTDAKKNIDDVIKYAINKGEFDTSSNKEDIDIISFCRWAIRKTRTKKSTELRWPWLSSCINLPPLPEEPIIASGPIITIENNIVPSNIKEAQKHLVKAWNENALLVKENNLLKNDVNRLGNKKKQQREKGTESALKRWKK